MIGYNEGASILYSSPKEININVKGFDCVGGVIGRNDGNLQNIIFTGTVESTDTYNGLSGENVGGIVGCNNGNDSGTYGKITKCYNKSSEIKGGKNTGGVVGVAYGGIIDYCGNEGNVSGTNKNTWVDSSRVRDNWSNFGNVIIKAAIEAIESNDNSILNGYAISDSACTGTGGICGKNNGAAILHSYNAKNTSISSNFNTGGIAGIESGGRIEYCFNAGTIGSTAKGRAGGIVGAGKSVHINYCYNTGSISGKKSVSPLWNGIGGIVGQLLDNGGYFGFHDQQIFTKYTNDVYIKVLGIDSSNSDITYCYNGGRTSASGDYDWWEQAIQLTMFKQDWHLGGIIGSISFQIDLEPDARWHPTIIGCYYNSDMSPYGIASSWSIFGHVQASMYGATNFEGKNTSAFKGQLYKWGSNGFTGTASEVRYVYNTVSPVETTKGYDGLGVLWWEMEGNYHRLETYIVSKYNTASDRYIKIRSGHNVKDILI